MILGIICAMEEEIRLIQKDMQSEQIETIAGREFHTGLLYGKQVVLALSRIGKVAASMTTSLMIDHFHADKIIFSGTAGGIDPALHTGDAVIADFSCQHDFKVPGGDEFRIPLLNRSYLESDPQLTQLALEAVQDYQQNQMMEEIPDAFLKEFGIVHPQAVVGTVASGDEFVCEKERNQWLFEHVRNIKCVEMEGAAVAQACFEFGVPFTLIRIISDGASDTSGVDFDRFIQEAACHFTRGAVRALLTRL